MKITEQRAHSRHRIYVCIRAHKTCGSRPPQDICKIAEMSDTSFLIGNLIEASISEDGIGFISEAEYGVGDIVKISIQFHDKQDGFATVLCGEVKWVRPVADGAHEAGVQFINIPERLSRKISEFIKAMDNPY
jgi:hypothetical protein